MPARYTPEQRRQALLDRVEVASCGCWLWTGYLRKDNYGDNGTTLAHREAYAIFIGPVPEGMTVDHLCHDAAVCQEGSRCHHRRCVNPDHLLACPQQQNAARHAPRNYCPQGHEYTEENRMMRKNGKYQCRACDRARRTKVTR
jgi:formylmethanofuran dehydrogenase subunit E